MKGNKHLQAGDLKDGFSKYGNKAAVWSNGKGTDGIHIQKDGDSATLCGVPMLSSNWARIEGLGTEHDYESIGCADCTFKYGELTQGGHQGTSGARDAKLLEGRGFQLNHSFSPCADWENDADERITYVSTSGDYYPTSPAGNEGPHTTARKAYNWLVRERKVKL